MHSPITLQPCSLRNKTYQNDQILKLLSSDKAYFARVFIGHECLLVSVVIFLWNSDQVLNINFKEGVNILF